jgi:deoxyribodipyrimidine photo-lyase
VIHPERVHELNGAPVDPAGRYVLYWMQQAQRAACNHALELAVGLADGLGLPVVAGFGLTDAYPEANERHYAFMLEGLAETARALRGRGIRMVVRLGSPEAVALALARDAALVVCDRGYLRHQRAWRRAVAAGAGKRVVEVETDLVVPLAAASQKHEVAARTLRPRIARRLDEFLQRLAEARPRRPANGLDLAGDLDPEDVDGTLRRLRIDRSVGRVARFRGGHGEARARLKSFIAKRLPGYATGRNDPSRPKGSELSPYLHFGQIAPLEVALAARQAEHATAEDRTAFLEELIVRRQLSFNHMWHEPSYDDWGGLPAWARRTLDAHRRDPRPFLYDVATLEAAKTHDPYWNAAMREMRITGHMHGYMRMYWGKKILEWSASPEEGLQTALRLNNRWLLDGRDANSYAGCGWCFGLHDRPWAERPIFGTVRYMSASGLKRKLDIEAYVGWTKTLGG